MGRRSVSTVRLGAIKPYERTPQEVVAERMFGVKRDLASPDDLEFFHGLILGWHEDRSFLGEVPLTCFNKIAQRKNLDLGLLKVAMRVCSSEGIGLKFDPIFAKVEFKENEISPIHLARVAMVDFGIDPAVPEEERSERMARIIGPVEHKSQILGNV